MLENWAKLKAKEKKAKHGHEGSVLDGVPTAAPALMRAERLTEKASRIGFDWPDLAGVRGKLDEELRELDEAIASGDRDALEHELGDVLFSLCNLARFIKTPPEDALRQANRRFTTRFHEIEAGLRADGVAFGEATLEQMERYWQAAKAKEKALPPARALPRASVTSLALPCPDLAASRACWDRLAPALGWERDRQGRYHGGALALSLVEGPAMAGLSIGLEAPSEAAVAQLAAMLPSVPGVREIEHTAGEVRFRDPANVQVRYAIGA